MAERTLRGLYLEPLRERVAENGGLVCDSGGLFTLLVDVKSEASSTWAALERELVPYHEMLTRFGRGAWEPGPVTVLLSGNRARDEIEAARLRWAALDGRLSDLEDLPPASVMPLLSDHWGSHFAWRGDGEMPAAERRKLHELVAAAHARHRRLRFWAVPERTEVWRELWDAGVDLLGADDLDALADFMRPLEDAN